MYTYERRVTYSEVSGDHHADIAQIADYLQDTSTFSGEEVGFTLKEMEEMHRAWILASWQIEVQRPPVFGEKIRISTWPYRFDALMGYRNFAIDDAEGNRIVVANSQWIFLDVDTMHPLRITEEVASRYPYEPKAEMDYRPRKIHFKEEKTEAEAFVVPREFIDTNLHMNNAKYLTAALRYVPEGFNIRRVRVEYKNQAKLGDVLTPYIYADEEMVKIELMNAAGDISAIIEFQQ